MNFLSDSTTNVMNSSMNTKSGLSRSFDFEWRKKAINSTLMCVFVLYVYAFSTCKKCSDLYTHNIVLVKILFSGTWFKTFFDEMKTKIKFKTREKLDEFLTYKNQTVWLFLRFFADFKNLKRSSVIKYLRQSTLQKNKIWENLINFNWLK